MARDRTRPMILATRFGFHGKKGLAERRHRLRDRRRARPARAVHHASRWPSAATSSMRDAPFDPAPYQKELDALLHQFGRKIGTLITEPYLGGGGSYHPPKAYLQLLERFCREQRHRLHPRRGAGELRPHRRPVRLRDLRPRAGHRRARQGAGQRRAGRGGGRPGRPVRALDYGEGSDTWSANPLCCAAVLATLDEFEARDVLGEMPAVLGGDRGGAGRAEGAAVRRPRPRRDGRDGLGRRDGGPRRPDRRRVGERLRPGLLPRATAGDGIHLLGPLSKKVVRVAPPLVITAAEATAAMALMDRCAAKLAGAKEPELAHA